ncbi:AraC family transcriptional regulator [Pedobacter sp. BS3]|uniref:AraC family transcriptional regulator n=1 Tax=Pedobacter sp. BS3 TaxID=2567937 RepID=UPI0011EFF700|nr:AraC family transcriptional regulator [Pedobacter sp. BS3]TZF82673.1 AraC family transcriptional regulator [Pedobacter sp. BS3]
MDNITTERKKIKEGFVGQQMIVLPPDIKKHVVRNPLTQGLYLTAIGYYPKASLHDRERKSGSPQYILLYCIEGKGEVEVSKQRYTLTPNTWFIIPKNVAHHYNSDVAEPWSIYWVHFTGDLADVLYSRYTREVGPAVYAVPYDEQRIVLFNLIFSALESSFSTRNMELANIKLLQFLSSFIYHEEMYPSYYAVNQISQSIEFMKKNMDRCYTIGELAARLNYSVSHYSDLFKKKTGFSPIHYFNQLKIRQSCQYLYFTDMNIKEICSRVGFDDPYYFSRMFKKVMGMSPAKYRNVYKMR